MPVGHSLPYVRLIGVSGLNFSQLLNYPDEQYDT